MATLYVIATPIGNLEDLTLRALRILSEVDLILAEDTRVTKKLLQRHQIKTPLLSYHQHSQLQKVDYIVKLLRAGKNLALVSDAGTPGISDPGNKLIDALLPEVEDLAVVPIPGPSALIAAASVSGFPTDRFVFLGFLPLKNHRARFLQYVLGSDFPVIFYESTYKILKTLGDLTEVYQKHRRPFPRVVIGQELTKKFEKTYRGSLPEVLEVLKKEDRRGEFVVIVRNLS